MLNTHKLFSPRWSYGGAALICLGLLAFALYLQYGVNEEPCPLCILQRIAFIAIMVTCIAAALHNPVRVGIYLYSALILVFAVAGGAVATRQVWLQHLPKELVPACGPGLNYMLDKFPLLQVLEKVFKGSGECAEVGWTFLGFSIAEWSLLWFVLLAILALVVAVNVRSSRRKA
jgi:disulfide bond formation protein DsbB